MQTSEDHERDVSAAMPRRQALRLLTGLALCPLCATTGFAAESSWSYEEAAGPEKWGGLDPASAVCSAGDQQSPIDITAPVISRKESLKISWSKRPSRSSTTATPFSSTTPQATRFTWATTNTC